MSWPIIERILLTLWVGALWAIGYLSVPSLFHYLDDRMLAGTLAGAQFHAVAWLGIACGVLLLAGGVAARGLKCWRNGVLLLMLLLVVIGHFVFTPMLAELRAAGIDAGSGEAVQFARLHGISAILYLATSLLGLVVVAAGNRG